MVFETLPSLTAQKTFSYVFSPEFKWEKMKGGGVKKPTHNLSYTEIPS